MLKLVILTMLFSPCELLARVLKFDVGEEAWPPYSFYTDAQNRGIMIEVLEKLIAKDGIEVKVSFLPEIRATRELDHCHIDVKPKAIEWVEKAQNYLWSDPVVISQDIVITRKGKMITAVSQLNGKIIGTVRGYSYPTLEKSFKSNTIKRADASSTLKMLEMLAKEHTDVAVTNLHVFKWYLKNYPELATKLISTKVVVDQAPYRFQFCTSNEWKKLIPKINKNIAELKSSGELDLIIKRYE